MINETLIAEIKRHEAYRSHAYNDTRGVLTIGYGLNIDDGISEPLAAKILEWIIIERRESLEKLLPFWWGLTPARQEVLLNMAYNLGIPRFLKFTKMLAAAAENDTAGVCQEMRDSKWFREDVGYRAAELVDKYRRG
ncbi:MAG: glycoside hydrolase family protein [Limnohabitans sp.]